MSNVNSMDNAPTVNYCTTPENSSQCRTPNVDGLVVTQTVVLGVTNIFAVFINVIFFRVFHSCETFHPNVHFLLQNISCGILCHSLFGVCQCVYNIVLFANGYTNNALQKPWACVLFQSPEKISSACIMFTFLFIGVERYNFTIKKINDPKVIETSSWKIRLLAVFSWICGIPVVIEPLVNSRNVRICYCNLAYVTRDVDLYATAAILIAIQFVAIVMFPIVHDMNKRTIAKFGLSSTTHSLVERTRAWRNIRTTSMLLPSAVVQGTVFTVTFILIVSTQSYVLNADSQYNYDFKIACLWLQLFSIFNVLHPILCVRHHHLLAVSAKEKSKILFWLASRFSNITQVDVVGEAENFAVNPDKQQTLTAQFWNKSPSPNTLNGR